MNRIITGNCLCGRVSFEVEQKEEGELVLCHCKQCQKTTGSSNAANLLVGPDEIKWLSGKNIVISYKDATRNFNRDFCNICGSAVPYITRDAKFLVVPAGSLNSEPKISKSQNIFWSEHPNWRELERFDYSKNNGA